MYKNRKTIGFLILVIAIAAASGCATLGGGAIGAVGGGAIGAIIGNQLGDDKATALGAIIGAAVGGTAGALIGNQMDIYADILQQAGNGFWHRRYGNSLSATVS